MANGFKVKNNLAVSGSASINGSVTGVTEAFEDNSTKLASTQWVRNYLTIGSATASNVYKIKESFTATAGQTTFTINGGYFEGNIDVYVNGAYQNSNEVTAINGSTIILTESADTGDIIDTVKLINVNEIENGGSGTNRTIESFTATAGQTVFTVVNPLETGYFDVYINGVRVSDSSFTNTLNTITLADGASLSDIVDVISYSTVLLSQLGSLVGSINGQTGEVILDSDDLAEGLSNLYFTLARSREAISLTTTGSSGAATYNSTTGVLNIPTYSFIESYLGTVTSVELSVPVGFSVTGSPVTSAGTLALAFASGYSLPTTASQTNWNTSYGWGDHSVEGYLTSFTETDPVFVASAAYGITGTNITNWNSAYSWGDHSTEGYLTSFTETDPVYVASSWYTTTNNASNWNTAFGWGNHATAGYLTSYTETDPIYTASSWYSTTNNSSEWDDAYLWGDHALAGYLTSFSETDPIYTGSSWYTTTNNAANWNTAYLWGDHSLEGYLTSFSETDPTVPSHVKAITVTNISNWDTSFSWGDHSLEGYLTSYTETDPIFTASAASGITATNITNWNTAYLWGDHSVEGYLTSFTETDPVFTGSAAFGITNTNISNWNTAYTWGDHGVEGYLTSYTETDPVFVASAAYGITGTDILNWNTAYGWGNHSVAGYLTTSSAASTYQPLDGDLTAIAALIGTSGLLKKTAADTWSLDTNTYLTSFTETDPIFVASAAFGITGTNITNWNTAYSWGNHALSGYELASNKGVAGGYASLDGAGKVPAIQLPSYVDDVLEYVDLAAFPVTGESAKIYIAIDTNKTYRWTGTLYVEISASPGSTDSVTEGSTNLYFTNTRARAAISVTGSLSYNSSTGVISYTQPTNVSAFTNDANYITNGTSGLTNYYLKTDIQDFYSGSVAITGYNKTNWDAAFGWGNHSSAGYLTTSVAASTYVSLSGSYTDPIWITSLAWNKISSTPTTLSGYGITDAQALDADLTAIAALVGTTGFLTKTATNTWALDTNTYYLASNPNGYTTNVGSVTSVSVASANGFAGTVATATSTPAITISTTVTGILKGNGTAVSAAVASTDYVIPSDLSAYLLSATAASTYQPLDADLTAIAALSGTSGLLKKAAADTWSLDTSVYLTSNQTITLSGAVSGSGSTAISTTLANSIVGISNLSATGTPSSTTYLRGDNTWATIIGGGSGTVTSVSIVSANGFAGSVATDTTTPAITLSTTVTGILKGNGTAISAATANTDYLAVNNPVYTGTLSTGTLTYTAANLFLSAQRSQNSFIQAVFQNTNAGATASADVVVNNNLSTDTTYYGDFGINSSAFTGSGSLTLANAVYLTATTGDLVIGTTTSNAVHIVVNSGATDAVTIKTTGQFQLPGYTSTSSFAGTATGYLAFDSSGNILSVAAPSASGGYTVTTQTTAHSVTATSGTIIVKGDTTGGTFIVTLPTAVANTATIIIKKTAGSAALTVDGAGTETIDGGLTATINKIYESITLISDNTNWQII